jgi:hypothetical protein
LEEELNRRKEKVIADAKPKVLSDPDFTKLIAICQEYIDYIIENRRSDNDDEGHIYPASRKTPAFMPGI